MKKIALFALLALLVGRSYAAVYELLSNGSFEDVENGLPVSWMQFMMGRSGDKLSVTNDAQRGNWAVAIATPPAFTPDTVALYTGTDGGGRGGFPVVPGATYRMKAMVRSTRQAMIRLYLRLGDGGGGFLGGMFSGDIHTVDEWREYSFAFTLPDNRGLKKVGAGVFVYTPNDVIRIDNVSLTFDTSENPNAPDIYRRDPPPTRTLDLAVSGGAWFIDGKPPAAFLEGLHAVTIVADGKTPLRIASSHDKQLVRRWRFAAGEHSEANDAAFDDRAWPLVQFATDGTVKPPCEGAYTLRQVVLWNANKDSAWKLFLAGTKEYAIPAGAVDTLFATLYSPFDFPLEDFAINVKLPKGFRFADLMTHPVPDDWNRRMAPKSVRQDGACWRFNYGEIAANVTRTTLLPLVAPELLADGTSFQYCRTAKGNVTELPVTVPIRALPPIRNNGNTPFVFEGYETGMMPPMSEEHARLHFAQAAKVGENRFFLNGESASFAKYYEAANPEGLVVYGPSGAFPLTLKLWGTIDSFEREMIAFMASNSAAQVRFRGGTFKPLMREDHEHNIHYAAWCPTWVNGAGKRMFQEKLTDVFTRVRAKNPRVRRGWIDWETSPFRGGQDGSWCWCDTCKRRFAEKIGLKSVPSDDEIAAKYVKEWNDFRFACDAETVRTIQEATGKAGVDMLVYSGDSVTPFYDFKGDVKEVFATVPGNSPACAYRQSFLEKLTEGICTKAQCHNFIAQRFARLGPNRGKDGWKTMTVCSTDGIWQDGKLWKSQIVRMLVSCQGGVDIQNLLYYPASAQYWMAEGLAAVKPYAELIRCSKPAKPDAFASSDIAYPDVVVIEKNGTVLACLYNELETPKSVRYTLCGRQGSVTIPPQDVALIVSRVAGASVRTCLSGTGWTLDGVSGVTVPHTWNAADATDGVAVNRLKYGHNSVGSDSYVRKKMTYSRALPNPQRGKRYFVQCEGVSSVATVAVNGSVVGTHAGAFTAFGFEITQYLNATNNVLAIAADNTLNPDVPPISGDFNLYGGVYRDVWLIEAEPPCIDPLRAVAITADARTGHVVADVPVLDGTTERQSFDFPNPTLWSPENPKMYEIAVKVGADTRIVPVGFRTVELRDGVFYLNGQARQIRGVCRHQDRTGKGWAVSAADEEEDILWIKKMGADGVRTSHYPQSRRFYDLCDRAGLIVWTELPNVNGMTFSPAFRENLFTCAREMVAQLGNHPSICLWGLFNELYNAFPMPDGQPEALMREANDFFHRLDPTRPTVSASNDPRRIELNAISDGLGLNLYPLWYDWPTIYGDGMEAAVSNAFAFARRPFSVSEYGGSGCLSQHADPLFRPAPICRFHPEEYQAYMHATLYRGIAGNPHVWGSFLWQMFDCGSDCRQEGDCPGINEKGLVTFDRRTAKDAFYFYKANWNAEPMLHLVGTRRTETTNATTTVLAFSNVGAVTLSVNGQVIGTRQPDAVKTVCWRDVPLSPGNNDIVVTAPNVRACQSRLFAALKDVP